MDNIALPEAIHRPELNKKYKHTEEDVEHSEEEVEEEEEEDAKQSSNNK